MDVILKRILQEKAKELGLTLGQAEDIFKSVPRFISEVIEEGNIEDLDSYKSVYIKDLGTFYPHKRMIEKLRSNKMKKNEDIQSK
jgi:maltose-binding protein MalE